MKVAVVTGSAKGLGADICRALVADGFTPIVHYYKSREDAEELVEELKKNAPDSFAISADLTSEQEVFDMFKRIGQEVGTVDLLINNVGNFIFKPFAQTSNSEFKDMIESNILSTFYCCRAVLGMMREKKGGNIINVGSVGSERLVIRENSTPYYLGKTGVYVLTKAFAAEEAKHGIRINMVSPASLTADIFKMEDFPTGRPASHEDVIKAIKFLISVENSYINGANIEVAGGFIPGYK